MTLITDTADLESLVARLRTAPYVTVDTEFMRETTFWPKLCLIQLADAQGAYAVDPLAQGLDLAAFYELMFDEGVLKVFHACRQDMEIFFHATGRLPVPVFDTQVAAMVCGYGDSVGYETLVKKVAGKSLDKTARFTDWSRRPLSERQIRYALGDVTYLREIYERLSAELERTGRQGWVAEEMALLTDPATYEMPPEDAWRRIKLRSGSSRFLARVQALAKWREEEARRRDVPRSRIAKDNVLTEVAAHPPARIEQLDEIRGLSKGFHKSGAGRGLWKALEDAEAIPDSELPPRRRDDRDKSPAPPVTELLKLLLKLRCREAGVASRLVASADEIEAIARDDGADVKPLKGWRYELFGRDALALKHGRLAIAATRGDVEIIELEEDTETAETTP